MTSYSQCGQDIWVNAMLEGKRNLVFIDIGANHPVAINNTYALESELGWTGILVDLLPGCETRKGKFFQCDASNPTPALLMAYADMPSVVGFLSLDVDDATLDTFWTLPWDTHRFQVACIEHDAYRGKIDVRSYIRNAMACMGYELVCGDVSVRFPDPAGPPGPFEDWFCDPKLVKRELIDRFKCDGKEWCEIVRGLT